MIVSKEIRDRVNNLNLTTQEMSKFLLEIQESAYLTTTRSWLKDNNFPESQHFNLQGFCLLRMEEIGADIEQYENYCGALLPMFSNQLIQDVYERFM